MVITQLIAVQPRQLLSRSIINGTWATQVSCLVSYLLICVATSPQPYIPLEMVILIDTWKSNSCRHYRETVHIM